MIRVKSTREGRIGSQTSTGWIITESFPFVALPSTKALKKWVRVRNPINKLETCAMVLDVGPWNTHDDVYVFQPATTSRDVKPLKDEIIRPLSEKGISISGKGTNGAGIDLGEFVWHELDMKDNTEVEWEFI